MFQSMKLKFQGAKNHGAKIKMLIDSTFQGWIIIEERNFKARKSLFQKIIIVFQNLQ